MSENDEIAKKLRDEQERANRDIFNEVTQGIEAGFRLESQQTAQREAARRNRDERERREQNQEAEKQSALKSAQEYEDENMRKAREAGEDIAGHQDEPAYGYSDQNETSIQNDMTEDEPQTPETSNFEGQTSDAVEDQSEETTYEAQMLGGVEAPSMNYEASEEQEGVISEPTYELAISNENEPQNTQTGTDMNDTFAAWKAENQMRSATLEMNAAEKDMFKGDFGQQTDTYTAGDQNATAMGSFTQDLSNDNRVLYKSIRTGNTDMDGGLIGPEPQTKTANTQPNENAPTASKNNRNYVDDQTFAARFDDTVFWKSDERKKAWEQFINVYKNSKTVEDLIENGFFASLELGLDMINAYMDWEVAEGKKLAGFVKESKKTYDADQNKANGISPGESYKRTHDYIHACKNMWEELEKTDFSPTLPRNDWGGIDLKNCTPEQKAMLGEFQVRFAQSSPEFREAMQNQFGREFNGEDIAVAADGTRTTLHGFEDGPNRNQKEHFHSNGQPKSPSGPDGKDDPQPTSGGPNPKDLTPKGPTPSDPIPMDPIITEKQISLNNQPQKSNVIDGETNQVLNDFQTPDKETMRDVSSQQAPQRQERPFSFDTRSKQPDIIDEKTGQVLDGYQMPDKETMRDVTPPKGPLKNVRPADFADMPKRTSDNINNMHNIRDGMNKNQHKMSLIEMSRNDRPAQGGRAADQIRMNLGGRGAA